MGILGGQYIPTDNNSERQKIMFIGEKPSDYFLKHPEKRKLGNFNVTRTDMKLQEYIKKYLGQVYITDMVKTEGKAGADFETEWYSTPTHKQALSSEIEKINPEKIVFLSNDAERLFLKEFSLKDIKFSKIYHPSYVVRYKKYSNWDDQFKKVKYE